MDSTSLIAGAGIDRAAATNAFAARFGASPQLAVRAPGRVNLIGEHTDYHDGFVLPMAIDRWTVLLGRARSDRRIRAYSQLLGSAIELDLDSVTRHPERWARYLQGVVAILGARRALERGCDVLIGGSLPVGGGLSSSSALVVGFTRVLAALQGWELPPGELAQIGCDAEHWYGTTGGIMDQFVISHGRAGHAVLIDCRSLQHRAVRLPASVTVVIASTGVSHNQIQSPFADRRREAEAGLRVIQSLAPEVRALRDVTPDQLHRFRRPLLAADATGLLLRRCRHVATENARVLDAVTALESGDLPVLGRLMAASQASLRHDYEVSSRELDVMVEAATSHPGCIGARLTGGGFGGCTVNLVERDAVASFCGDVARAYAERTGIRPDIFAVSAADGVTCEG